MNPLFAPFVVPIATTLINDLLGPQAAPAAPGLTAAQVQAMLAAQQAASGQRTALYVGLALAAVGVIAAVLIARK